MEKNFQKLEKKWQKKWEQAKVFECDVKKKGKKFYVMEMFPYPSALGLHLGHALNFTIGDILARFKRMNGFNVLYPMGFDAMGLPAENAAIKADSHPKPYTEQAIKNYIKQMKDLGLSYDWSKMVSSMEPEYYKWNQFFFLKFLEKGLAYRKKAAVNWCPKCNTVLANEQVVGGCCWRHEDTEVEIKHLEQWFLKITDYAEELLNCIDDLQWPQKIKTMQKNWIGKSYGTEIDFEVNGGTPKGVPRGISTEISTRGKKFPVFTTRPDTIYGVTFMVISAQHEKLMELVTNEQKKEVEKFLKRIKSTKQEDMDKLDKEGVFTGSCAVNPITKEKVPIWAGNFVVAEYGSGMVMGVPAHDKRDFDFAKKYDLPVRRVIAKKDFARSIVWGSEITKGDLESIGVKIIEEVKTKNKEYDEMIKKVEFPIEASTSFEKLIQDKLPKGFWNEYVGSKGIVFNFKNKDGNVERLKLEISNEKEIDKKCYEFFYDKKVDAKWQPNNIWKSLACAENNFYKDLIVHSEKGQLENSDKFNGLDNEKAKEEITKFLEKKKLGRKKVQFKMRDWLISRQRYWGTPIPIVYCDKCGIVPIDEKDLPIKLPEKVTFGKGNPLATNEKFVNVKCPKCNGKARRETDTMDTFVDSSWYFMRYPDNKNSEKPFDKKIEEDWLPVDQYIGGIEHATMHLLYSRFWTKALRDLGYINYGEPFTKLFNQGMLHGEDGNKMSKSIGNVILPEVVSKKYGTDTARFFLMSLAAPDKARDWSDKGVLGSLKFINKIMDYFGTHQVGPGEGCTTARVARTCKQAPTRRENLLKQAPNNIQKNIVTKGMKVGKSSAKIESKLNKTIKEVTEYIENFKYNLAVIKIRELFNSFGEEESKEVLEKSLKLLHPFCPHITEELWEKLGNKNFITTEKWPAVEEKKIDEKFEKQEQAVEKLRADIEHVKKLTGKSTAYVYVLPNELELYKDVEGIDLFAVNDKKKYDPENKSKKAKPGKPGIYLE